MLYNLNNDDLEIIIKNIIETKKAEEAYGYITDEYEFPYPIEKKLELLNPSEYEDVINICEEIADKTSENLNGELNMLHRLHEEIQFMLNEYIL